MVLAPDGCGQGRLLTRGGVWVLYLTGSLMRLMLVDKYITGIQKPAGLITTLPVLFKKSKLT